MSEKLTALASGAPVALTDLLYFVKDPSGSPLSRRATFENVRDLLFGSHVAIGADAAVDGEDAFGNAAAFQIANFREEIVDQTHAQGLVSGVNAILRIAPNGSEDYGGYNFHGMGAEIDVPATNTYDVNNIVGLVSSIFALGDGDSNRISGVDIDVWARGDGASNQVRGIELDLHTDDAHTPGDVTAIHVDMDADGTGEHNDFVCFFAQAQVASTVEYVGSVKGLELNISSQSPGVFSGIVIGLEASVGYIASSPGSLSVLAGAQLGAIMNGTATVTDMYGLQIADAKLAGTVTNAYGLHINDHSAIGSTISRNIHSAGVNSLNLFEGDVKARTFTVSLGDQAIKSSVAMTDRAASGAGTISNAPHAGNPDKWIAFNDNGTLRAFPVWNV